MIVAHPAPDVITRLERRSWLSLPTLMAELRGWGARQFGDDFPRHGALATALVLGDGEKLSPKEWEKYVRTGVIHVLVVSGQHLVVLAAFLLFLLRFTPFRYRTGIVIVVGVLWLYAILTGGRPPVVRAAMTMTVFAGGLLLRRPTLPLNALAAAWLLVLMLNPADVADLGCLLSFACVAALYWDFGRREARKREEDPLDALIEQSRPAWQRAIRSLGRMVVYSYAVGALLWVVVAPLAIQRNHYVPIAGLVIGPPVILCTSLALIGGFLVLLTSTTLPVLTPLFVSATAGLLSLTEAIVDVGASLSPRHLYVPDIPHWWTVGFYVLLAAGTVLPRFPEWRRRALLAGAAWVAVGVAAVFVRIPSDETRVTFLAVGHGGCTVIETPDGRTILYDAGSTRGPNAVRMKVAPYLWHRGVRHIDEVIVSHADLDHYNGLRDIMDCFSVGRITLSHSFGEKMNPSVRYILDVIEGRGVPVERVAVGDRLHAGKVTLDVLHPPKTGPEGVENVRSLVLLVRQGRHSVLLTGDIEKAGLTELLASRPQPVDVLMAPHHGSRSLDVDGLLRWAKPSLIVSCQEERPAKGESDPYRRYRKEMLETSAHGAVTLRMHPTGIVVETYVTKRQFVLRSTHNQ
jgi:competence protein ComEC